MEFIWNESRTMLINVSHIVQIRITEPELSQKYYVVFCDIDGCGCQPLYSGSLAKCEEFLRDFHYKH